MPASRTQTVAPTFTPIDVAELKAHARIDHGNDDADLLKLIGYVTSDVETFLGWQLAQATWRIDADKFEAGKVLRPLPAPLIAVTSIAYYDPDNVLTTWDAANYEVDSRSLPARIRPVEGVSWPSTKRRYSAVQVTFTAGHATAAAIPGWAKLAIRIECTTRYEMRLNAGNVNTNLPGFHAAETKRLLEPHRLAWQFGQGFEPFEEET